MRVLFGGDETAKLHEAGSMLGRRFDYNAVPLLQLNDLQKEMRRQVDRKVDSGAYQFEEVPCCICEGTEFQPLAGKDRYGLRVSVVICRKCGLIQTNPRMNQIAYNEFYNTEYRKLYVGKEKAGHDFFASQYRKGRRILRYLKTHGHMPDEPSNVHVLEVGCGAGGILQVFKEQGCSVAGIDLGEDYIEFGKSEYGLDLSVCITRDYKPSRIPDIVIYSHVLEHILDPVAELEEIRRILGDDSVIYIEVPGIRNLTRSFEMDFLRYLQNAHVYHFTLRTLKNLMSRGGFDMVEGSEEIYSVFRKNTKPASLVFENDYEEVLQFLKRVERRRKALPFAPYRLREYPKEFAIRALKLVRLHALAKTVYNRISPQSPRTNVDS